MNKVPYNFVIIPIKIFNLYNLSFMTSDKPILSWVLTGLIWRSFEPRDIEVLWVTFCDNDLWDLNKQEKEGNILAISLWVALLVGSQLNNKKFIKNNL